jgi:hypothetical protein
MKGKKSYGTVILGKDQGKYRFSKPNTLKGRANKVKVLTRLGLKAEQYVAPKYFMVNGMPHKFDENGNKVPLTLQVQKVYSLTA